MNSFFQWLADLCRGVKFWTLVLPWERGLRVRLGRWTRLLEPGIHPRIPFLDHMRLVNTRMRIAAVPCVTVTSRDGKTVTVAGCVAFRLTDPYKVLLTVQHPEDAAAALTQSAMAEYIATRGVAELSIPDMEMHALECLRASSLDGFAWDFVKTVDFAIVRTYRLLQEQWRPSTGNTNMDENAKGVPPA